MNQILSILVAYVTHTLVLHARERVVRANDISVRSQRNVIDIEFGVAVVPNLEVSSATLSVDHAEVGFESAGQRHILDKLLELVDRSADTQSCLHRDTLVFGQIFERVGFHIVRGGVHNGKALLVGASPRLFAALVLRVHQRLEGIFLAFEVFDMVPLGTCVAVLPQQRTTRFGRATRDYGRSTSIGGSYR